MGGGGGDGGYQERADSDAAKKQRARDAVNAMFGVAPTMGASAPDRAKFTTQRQAQVQHDQAGLGYTPDDNNMGHQSVDLFDQKGFDAAQGEYSAAQALAADAAKNKTARDALYGTVRENAFTAGRRSLDEANADAKRKTKFALFDRGLNGSSLEDDQYNLLDRTYKQGMLDLGAKADATKADLMGNDENTRLGLLQSLDAGMDQGSAISSALNTMKVNSEKAAATQIGTNVGDLFAGSGALYTQNRQNQQNQRQWQDFRTANPGLFSSGGGFTITTDGRRP